MRQKHDRIIAMDYRKKGGKKILKERGTDYFSALGSKGGKATSAAHGPEHFIKIGLIGLRNRWKKKK